VPGVAVDVVGVDADVGVEDAGLTSAFPFSGTFSFTGVAPCDPPFSSLPFLVLFLNVDLSRKGIHLSGSGVIPLISS